MFTNLQSLNQAQTALAKRLIERMSSLIIDKESFETLIDLVEYKIKQKLTPKQRKLIKKSNTKNGKQKPGRKPGRTKSGTPSDSDNDDDSNAPESDSESDMDDENDAETIDDSQTDGDHDHSLLNHIDDDGEKGLKLLNLVLSVHTSYGFANTANYKTLIGCLNTPKDHIVASLLKLLASHFTYEAVRHADGFDAAEHRRVSDSCLTRVKSLCRNGKPKQAKNAVYFVFNCFERPRNETILVQDVYKSLVDELEKKNEKTFVACLISLGHVCVCVPKHVGKEVKEFLLRAVFKDVIMQPSGVLGGDGWSATVTNSSTSSLVVSKKRNNLKLAGKWCEDEDELPFVTRAKVRDND